MRYRPSERGAWTQTLSRSMMSDETTSIDGPRLRTGDEERIAWRYQETVVLTCGAGFVAVHGAEPDEARIDYDDSMFDVLLRVDDSIELRDGDVIGAGQRWFRYVHEHDAQRPQLQILDDEGTSQMTVAMHDGRFALGREFGNLVFPTELELAPCHLEILVHDDEAFLKNLGRQGDTWLVLPPGEAVPANGTLAIDDRLVQLKAPPPAAEQ